MIFKLFSERKKEESGADDVYQYDKVTDKLRVQIQQILADAIGRFYVFGYHDLSTPDNNNDGWEMIVSILRREYGVHYLRGADNPAEEFLRFIGDCKVEEFIDALEVACRYIGEVVSGIPQYRLENYSIKMKPEEALDEVNYRLRQASFGYQYENGAIFRVDDEFVHKEVVKPAIRFLHAEGFSGPRDEFFRAHSLYREGKHSLAVVECGKAFESALKSVCDIKGWEYEKGDRASDLIKIIRRNELIPNHLDKSFDQLIATLASGLPQLRNNEGAHGQGATQRQVPRPIAEYALHLCAAKIALIAGLATGQS
ncbi:hypothetical protein EH31_14955 [Erythrobacter longus]|uniref:Abortive infection protein-like C-terminal domain-containing protein n=1 Tax=Erythrobacter longus TaxID=1044 RepID=A0A074MSY1_ERYLO|nr:hypothetical protein [Erythrobacter longus]KEO88737.1 hypothetical protein EH31_14955 [Erythrobacter longus]